MIYLAPLAIGILIGVLIGRAWGQHKTLRHLGSADYRARRATVEREREADPFDW